MKLQNSDKRREIKDTTFASGKRIREKRRKEKRRERERERERLIYRSNNRPNASTTDNAATTDNASSNARSTESIRAELRESARRFVLTIVNARNGERDVTLDDR